MYVFVPSSIITPSDLNPTKVGYIDFRHPLEGPVA